MARRLLQQLKDRGFDMSEKGENGVCLVQCSQCEALVISGVACHEQGCPNERKGSNGNLRRDDS